MDLKNSEDDMSERIRRRLNDIPERDPQGNERRFEWQLLTYVASDLLISSPDLNKVMLGRELRKGAIESFADLAGPRLAKWLRDIFG